MSTLTGQYISQSYGGIIKLSTNTGIVAGTYTALEDGLGTSLGWAIKTGGILSGSQLTASVFGTASWAERAVSASYAITASYALNIPTSISASYLSGSTAIVNNDITIVGGYAEPMTIGYGKAGVANTNIAIGNETLTKVAGGLNIALGFKALKNVSGSSQNIAIGTNALRDFSGSINDNNNIVIGNNAAKVLTRGNSNVLIGNDVAAFNAVSNAFNNNTVVGDLAGRLMDAGEYNIALGYRALYGLISGSRNIGIGWETLVPNTGNRNVLIGVQAGKNVEGSDSTFVGDSAGLDVTTGTDNTIIGYNTGRGITTGVNNTILGANVTGLSSSLANNIILADGAGNIRARYSGSWTMSGIVNTTASFAQTASYALAGNFVGLASNNTYTGNQVYSGSVSFRVVAPPIASSTASLNLASGSFFLIDLPGGNTHITAVSASRGQSAVLQLTQPFAGNATVTFSSTFTFPTGSAFSASLSQSAVDVLSFVSFDGTKLRSIGANNYI